MPVEGTFVDGIFLESVYTHFVRSLVHRQHADVVEDFFAHWALVHVRHFCIAIRTLGHGAVRDGAASPGGSLFSGGR